MLLHFVDEGVLKYEPEQVFLMIGTNDLGNTLMLSPRDIALNVKELIEIIHYNLPHCKIHLLSCIPVSYTHLDVYKRQGFTIKKSISVKYSNN